MIGTMFRVPAKVSVHCRSPESQGPVALTPQNHDVLQSSFARTELVDACFKQHWSNPD
jgi:hypothetical protein